MKTVSEVEELIASDPTKYWWETYAKVFVSFRPARGSVLFRKDGWYNRAWRGKNKWGTINRVEIGEDGLFNL